MIRKDDVQWWMLEIKRNPAAAAEVVEELARRLEELDAENERLREEVIHLQRQPAQAAAGDEVTELRRKVALLRSLVDGSASSEPSLVLLSQQLQALRVPLSRAEEAAHTDARPLQRGALLHLRRLLLVCPHEELLLLTNHAHGLQMALADVPPLIDEGDWPSAKGPALAADEWLAAATAVGTPPRFWTVVTRRGFVRQVLRIGFERDLAQGNPVVESPFRRDEPVAIVSGDTGDLLVLTRWGHVARFPQASIAAQGEAALELEPDDEVAAALALPADGEVVILTASGSAMRRDTAQVAGRSKPGGAPSVLIQAYDVLAAFLYNPQARLLYLTQSGRLILFAAPEVPLHLRYGKGSQVRNLERDPAVAATLIPGD